MKIIINEFESYEIKLNDKDEISTQRFKEILNRFLSIDKLLSRSVNQDIFVQKINSDSENYNVNDTSKQKRKPRGKYNSRKDILVWRLLKDRNFIIEVLKLHHHGTQELKDKFIKKYNADWNLITVQCGKDRVKFNIQPEEVYLSRWRRSGETSILSFTLKPDYVFTDERNILKLNESENLEEIE